MSISVIVPVYNEEKDIKMCLGSLAKQNMANFEVIVVDDGSTDSTKEIIEKAKTEIDRFNLELLVQVHQGPATARNLGAKSAKGDVLVFVDADMTFEKVFLRKLVAPIVSGKALATYSLEEYVGNWENGWARAWNINEDLPAKRRHKLRASKLRYYYEYIGFVLTKKTISREEFERERQKGVTHVIRAIKKSAFKKIGGYDKGGYTDDYSLGKKARFEAFVAEGAKYYHNNPSSLKEVYAQAKWAAKRDYKFGRLGILFVLLRVSLPVTVAVGIAKAVFYRMPRFIVFKLIYNTAATMGIIEYHLLSKGAK